MPRLSPFAVATTALAFAACGGSPDRQAGPEMISPAEARHEVSKTRGALNAALATYRGGDAAAAQDQVADAYLQHFEEVEAPLGARDPALKERLEEGIATGLRDSMNAGRPAAEVGRAVRRVLADLDRAEAALR